MTFKVHCNKLVSEFGSEPFNYWGLVFYWAYFNFKLDHRSPFDEKCSIFTIKASTKVEFFIEKYVFWSFTVKILGFGITVSRQTGY